MTIIELFPFLAAIGAACLAGLFFRNTMGITTIWAPIGSAIVGVAAFGLYWLSLKKIVSFGGRKSAQREARERQRRAYQDFDASSKDCPIGKDVFYECVVCTNVIPSISKKGATCKCGNLRTDLSGHPMIRERDKIRIFHRT